LVPRGRNLKRTAKVQSKLANQKERDCPGRFGPSAKHPLHDTMSKDAEELEATDTNEEEVARATVGKRGKKGKKRVEGKGINGKSTPTNPMITQRSLTL